MGRPSKFTLKIADEICERLADGESLRTICEAENMPSRAAVFRWLASDESFRNQYAHARDAQADTLADEILNLADECRIGVKTTRKANGDEETVTADMVERTRVQIDARKWLAGKLKPKVYGEKQAEAASGAELTGALAEIIARLPN